MEFICFSFLPSIRSAPSSPILGLILYFKYRILTCLQKSQLPKVILREVSFISLQPHLPTPTPVGIQLHYFFQVFCFMKKSSKCVFLFPLFSFTKGSIHTGRPILVCLGQNFSWGIELAIKAKTGQVKHIGKVGHFIYMLIKFFN